MTTSRASIFRDALQVSPDRISIMGDADLSELMRDLLRAQAHICQSPLDEVRVNTEDKAKDDGCDGWTAKPVLSDAWLGDVDTCWQFKAGTAGEPARLKGEVLKEFPKRILGADGRFVVVASGSTSGKKGEDDRLKTLRMDATTAGIPVGNIEVIGSERLAEWCNRHPAVAARWAGRPEGLWTLRDWSRAEVHQLPWQATDKVTAEISAQRAALDFTHGTVQHLHIQGQPGVGKTRFALELCRKAPWCGSVIYIQQATDVRLPELVDSAAADLGVRLIVVADEIQPEQLRSLRESVGRASGRLRLITVGHCKTPDPVRIPALGVSPLDQESTARVVRGWYPAMPPEHVGFIARFADGYLRLARMAADAVARDPTIDTRGLLSRDEIRGFLDGMLGPGDRRALHVVAVLNSIGWTEDKQCEGRAVAEHLGLDWNVTRASVEDYHRRLGIAPRGGRYRYISPTPLGIYLAVEAWTTYPELLRSLPDMLPSDEAKEAYFERLQSLASNPQAREYAREELASFLRLDDLFDTRAAGRWSSLAAADPEYAVRNMHQLLANSSTEDRLRIADSARRKIVWTLVRLAWRPGAFANAAKSLALLGEAENETWANNASAEFVSRFQLYLGGTAVPFCDRLPVLDELFAETRPGICRLVIRALSRVGERSAFRIGSDLLSDELPEKEWHPADAQEHLQCIGAGLDRLSALAERAIAVLQDDFVRAAIDLVMLLRDKPVRSMVERYLQTVRLAYPYAREPVRKAIADVIHRERKFWKTLPEEELSELETLHSQFEDHSLSAQLRQHVGTSQWDREEQRDLRPLAKQILESPILLADEWPWLTSGDAADAWRLGEALADLDSARSLEKAFATYKTSGRDFRVVCGYVCSVRRQLGDDWYNRWFDSLVQLTPRPVELLFEIAWRCGATPAVARQIAGVLRTDTVAQEIVGQLGYGRWDEHLDASLLEGVLIAMVEGGHRTTAVTILEHRYESRTEERERWRPLALTLVTSTELIRSGGMGNFHWGELASRLVADCSGEIAAAIIREQGDRSTGTWFTQHSAAEKVLLACAEVNPAAVWTALLPHLTSMGSAFAFSIGFPRGVIELIPAERVLSWIGEQPEERAPMVARLIEKDLSTDETLAARILGTHGDKEYIAKEFRSDYLSGSWTGPASDHWKQLADNLDAVADRTKLTRLRDWSMDVARDLRRMAEREKQREEEEDLRGR